MPYVADLNKANEMTGTLVGDGQCVTLAHATVTIPATVKRSTSGLSVSEMDRDTSSMMGINTMLSNSMRPSVLCIVLMVSTAAAPAHCPSFIDEAGSKRVMNNVSVFDGPPDQKADLIGDGLDSHGMWRWEADDIDPYLVCRYKDTARTVTFHAVGARYCYGGWKPTRAYCR
ncbi:STY0301 family protein [Lichenicoccus sp.]|uniref:STY0301 family protein n=1 Tax=Lichenicoccus sp. TaxID=2781899 RepID=UPI003D10850A